MNRYPRLGQEHVCVIHGPIGLLPNIGLTAGTIGPFGGVGVVHVPTVLGVWVG